MSVTVSTTNSNVDAAWSEEFMQQTQDVENVFRNLIAKDPESMDDFQKFASMLSKPGGGDAIDPDFFSNLTASAQSFSDQQLPSLNDEELSKMFSSIGLNSSDCDESSPDVSSLVQNMMQMLLSKDLLYPALRDITDRYANWLLENKETTEQEQYKKYETQYEIMQKICTEFEAESETDTPAKKKSRFDGILEMMQKMQDCGNPPTSLVGEGTSGLEFDEYGVPKIPGLAGLGIGNEKCQIM
uniref:Peroxin-19 n=1 Tax=Strigamia maritima TaxID=126957 RepID=T1J3M6_STRMM